VPIKNIALTALQTIYDAPLIDDDSQKPEIITVTVPSPFISPLGFG
jgi:hypothetical protein